MRAFFWRRVRLSLSLAVVGAGVLVLGAACGGDGGADSGKVQVVTTLPLFADFVRNVGGDRVAVTSLVPAGADPHTFEPSPSDVKKVAEADIAFANGLGLEPAAEKLIAANLNAGAPFVRLGEEAVQPGIDTPAPTDPHLWMDPEMAQKYVRVIDGKLVAVDPAGADAYANSTLEYIHAISAAHADASAKTESIPEGRRKLVTTHDAFHLLANALGLQVVAVVVESPGQEPSPGDVANISRTIKEQGVPAVFREPQLDSEGRVLEQAAKDAGVQVCVLYSDSLDDKVTSYIEMMRFNADEIVRCLGGDSGG